MARTPAKVLTPKQMAFVQEMIASGGQVGRSASKAGYSPNTHSQVAFEAGTRLLNNPLVKAELQKYIDQKREQTLVTKERIIQSFAEMAFNTSLKPQDRHKSLESLARIEGLFNDKITHTVQLSPEDRERRILEILEVGRKRAELQAQSIPATYQALPQSTEPVSVSVPTEEEPEDA